MSEKKELTRDQEAIRQLWFPDIDPKTGKLTTEHMEECTGCALCESDDPK